MNERKRQAPQVQPPNVIHVDFTAGRRNAQQVARPAAVPPHDAPPDAATVARVFSAKEVAELFGVSPRWLANWSRAGIVTPGGLRDGRKVYTFGDLLAVRTAKGLVEAGFATGQIRKAIERLRAQTPDLAQPLTQARMGSEGAQLLARRDGTTFDPVTGQLVLDFNVKAIRDDVVRTLKPRVSQRSVEAYEHYLEGLRLDEDETTRGRAEASYRRAIELDPQLATALTNLGNLRLLADDRDEAESLYRRAMAADATQPEAPYNLAYLLVERAERGEAVTLFRASLALRPDFAEAHFNLAMVLSELGDVPAARVHWRRYLDLEPSGPWSATARQHLQGAARD